MLRRGVRAVGVVFVMTITDTDTIERMVFKSVVVEGCRRRRRLL
jgi:hypothetical protein